MLNTELLLIVGKWVALATFFSFAATFTTEAIIRFGCWVASYGHTMWRE